VYTLLGVPDHLGFNFPTGGHKLAPEDWSAILDFADQQLRGMEAKRALSIIRRISHRNGAPYFLQGAIFTVPRSAKRFKSLVGGVERALRGNGAIGNCI
jgi:hypothetical protein